MKLKLKYNYKKLKRVFNIWFRVFVFYMYIKEKRQTLFTRANFSYKEIKNG